MPELLSPAGDWECLRAAIANGADAVYFGLPRFNARLRADNFKESELGEVLRFCHQHGVKAYVTMNVLIFTEELAEAVEELRLLNRCGVDAVIIQDVGLAWLAQELFPDLAVHASTQMSITSPEGVDFAAGLGARQVVLARELSLRELAKFNSRIPLEVFVHGALCVAYSGQCLTSESLGQRSANRGECAQACRLPYELIVDGVVQDLGDRRYLLSPQDLAGVAEIPALVKLGVASFKIEGRLKSAEYVAAVTAVYRKAIDTAVAGDERVTREAERYALDERYALEMTFSRGLYTGWLHGVQHQELVGARFGKKRGAFCGYLSKAGPNWFELGEAVVEIKPGDGVVFDVGGDTEQELGGRVYELRGRRIYLGREWKNLAELLGSRLCRVWKTSDPALEKKLRRSFAGRLSARAFSKIPLRAVVSGLPDEPLRILLETKREPRHAVEVFSKMPLQEAHSRPFTEASVREQLDRLAESPFRLDEFVFELEGGCMLPWSEFARLRRSGIRLLEEKIHQRAENEKTLADLLPSKKAKRPTSPELVILCRSMEQLRVVLKSEAKTIYVDFEDIRRFADAMDLAGKLAPDKKVFLATPRIQKAGEEGFFKLIERLQPFGILLRNVGGLQYAREARERGAIFKLHGDFSLNVANPLTWEYFYKLGIERLTASYDLTASQTLNLAKGIDPSGLEITLHQHIPMFHMEHCVFAAFMSNGKDFRDCGRPCEKHRVRLRDRVGMEHPLKADVGCRNTLFNASVQSGASFFKSFCDAGLHYFRIELLDENEEETERVLNIYFQLLKGLCKPDDVWHSLRARSQYGVTKGTLEAV
ncbi:MAG: DUF3656 domain-containing protein [Chthoniobacterales bacterium]